MHCAARAPPASNTRRYSRCSAPPEPSASATPPSKRSMPACTASRTQASRWHVWSAHRPKATVCPPLYRKASIGGRALLGSARTCGSPCATPVCSVAVSSVWHVRSTQYRDTRLPSAEQPRSVLTFPAEKSGDFSPPFLPASEATVSKCPTGITAAVGSPSVCEASCRTTIVCPLPSSISASVSRSAHMVLCLSRCAAQAKVFFNQPSFRPHPRSQQTRRRAWRKRASAAWWSRR